MNSNFRLVMRDWNENKKCECISIYIAYLECITVLKDKVIVLTINRFSEFNFKVLYENWKCTYKMKLNPPVRPPVKKLSTGFQTMTRSSVRLTQYGLKKKQW